VAVNKNKSQWKLNGHFGKEKMMFYFGPDTIMPLGSILAAIVGAGLIFWNRLVLMVRKLFRIGGGKSQPRQKVSRRSQP
jgi:hypothetical protein